MWNAISELRRNASSGNNNKAGTPSRGSLRGSHAVSPDLTSPRNLESLPADEAAALDDISGHDHHAYNFGGTRRGRVQEGLAKGWSNVLQGAKKGVAAAQEALKHSDHDDKPHYYSRKLNLPLDVEALEEAEVVYLTDRIASMSHPALTSKKDTTVISGTRKLAAVCHLLEKRHGAGNVMIWNLSEETSYHQQATKQLERVGPILAFSFPGYPAPPLGLWVQIVISMEKWLQASPNNVVVVHCLTGKGRTSTVLAAFLCWMAEAGFDKTNMMSALEYIAECKKTPVDVLTIPSQTRYAVYFTNMLEGIRPRRPPRALKKIIMSQAPKFCMGPPVQAFPLEGLMQAEDGEDEEGDKWNRRGCVPYLQIFQSGKLLHTFAATLPPPFDQEEYAIPWAQIAHGSVAFNINQAIQGDILIRCRHLHQSTGQKISMFRAALHTGYFPQEETVLRVTKIQLDGACNDPRFPDDFFIDLILEPCTPGEEESFYQRQVVAAARKEQEEAESGELKVEKDAVVSALTYDSMLHNDSRFWDVITEHLDTTESNQKDPSRFMGPTVGKRRNLATLGTTNNRLGVNGSIQPIQQYSIGPELDFLPKPETPTTVATEDARDKAASVQAASVLAAVNLAHNDSSRRLGHIDS